MRSVHLCQIFPNLNVSISFFFFSFPFIYSLSFHPFFSLFSSFFPRYDWVKCAPAHINNQTVRENNNHHDRSRYVRQLLSDEVEFSTTEEQTFFARQPDPVVDLLVGLLWEFLPCPMDHLFRIPEIYESDKFGHVDTHSKEWKEAKQVFKIEALRYDTVELFNMVSEAKQARFDNNKKYLSVAASLAFLNKWFDYQFPGQQMELVTDIFQVITSAHGKQNTFWVYGPSNCGKTLVFSALAEACVTAAYLKSVQGDYKFAFQVSSVYIFVLFSESFRSV